MIDRMFAALTCVVFGCGAVIALPHGAAAQTEFTYSLKCDAPTKDINGADLNSANGALSFVFNYRQYNADGSPRTDWTRYKTGTTCDFSATLRSGRYGFQAIAVQSGQSSEPSAELLVFAGTPTATPTSIPGTAVPTFVPTAGPTSPPTVSLTSTAAPTPKDKESTPPSQLTPVTNPTPRTGDDDVVAPIVTPEPSKMSVGDYNLDGALDFLALRTDYAARKAYFMLQNSGDDAVKVTSVDLPAGKAILPVPGSNTGDTSFLSFSASESDKPVQVQWTTSKGTTTVGTSADTFLSGCGESGEEKLLVITSKNVVKFFQFDGAVTSLKLPWVRVQGRDSAQTRYSAISCYKSQIFVATEVTKMTTKTMKQLAKGMLPDESQNDGAALTKQMKKIEKLLQKNKVYTFNTFSFDTPNLNPAGAAESEVLFLKENETPNFVSAWGDLMFTANATTGRGVFTGPVRVALNLGKGPLRSATLAMLASDIGVIPGVVAVGRDQVRMIAIDSTQQNALPAPFKVDALFAEEIANIRNSAATTPRAPVSKSKGSSVTYVDALPVYGPTAIAEARALALSSVVTSAITPQPTTAPGSVATPKGGPTKSPTAAPGTRVAATPVGAVGIQPVGTVEARQ